MNCTIAQQHINDWMDSLLPAQTNQSVQAHLDACAECCEKYAKEQQLRDLLRSLPVTPAQPGFATKVVERAIQHEQARQKQRKGFYQGVGVALAASIFLMVVIAVMPTADNSRNDNGLRIALHETHNLKLAFYAHKNMQNATVSINLPENVALQGYPGEKQLTWQVNLKKGDNSLSLPIRALQLASGELVATIEHGKQLKVLKVNISITEPGMSFNSVGQPRIS